MKTMFKSPLSRALGCGGARVYREPAKAELDQRLRENRKRDAKALFFIQSTLNDENFPRISAA